MANQPIENKPVGTDLRKYADQTNFRLVLWFFLILLFVGLGLVWIIYGRNAAVFGLLCLLGAGIPIALIAIVLFGLDIFTNKPK
jgi:hypothetical protein